MTELDLIIDLHKKEERQGPGSSNDTIRALSLIDLSKNKDISVADIGCGTGGQTITLAQQINGQISAVDLFPAFLEELNQRAKALGLDDKINTLESSMEDLPFDQASLDLIWSEGAIYNMGFEAGIKKWRDYLKPNGYLSVSEITWITNSRPAEIEDFWNKEYPEIDVASRKISILEENGYTLVGYFYLSEDSWMENYYKPIASHFSAFLDRHDNTELAKSVVKAYQGEIEMYKSFKEYFSYGFYIAQKRT